MNTSLVDVVGSALQSALAGNGRRSRADHHVYRWREGDGELPDSWTLEPGEAPVLLLACLDARDASTVERAMATAAAVAAVLLVEAQDGETEE